MKVKVKSESESESAQSCPTLCDPIDGSPPGSPVHGIFQARVLEWGTIAFSVACGNSQQMISGISNSSSLQEPLTDHIHCMVAIENFSNSGHSSHSLSPFIQ